MLPYISPEKAIQQVKSGERVFIHTAAATPRCLVDALASRNGELEDVEIVHLHTEGDAPYARPEYSRSFMVSSFFVGANIRPFVNHARVQYIPVFLSEVPSLFRKGIMSPDTALIQVSEPDQHGYCSLGVSVDITRAAVDTAKKIIAVVNPNMPRSHGDGQVHYKRFSSVVHSTEPIYETGRRTITAPEMETGKHVASLIEDGSTLQIGIGAIPDAVLGFLKDRRHLGIHTEMFSDGLLPLVECGAIDGSMKKNHPGKIVSTFALGSRSLYDFIHDNPMLAMLDAAYVNDTSVIARNDKMVAVNSAIEIDLTGQVCADSIGTSIYSGVGGQMDFIRGASLSNKGKPVIALTSTTSGGLSKIVPVLKPGAGVVTTRAHIHYVVTEYGIADLYGKTISQRAGELIKIAHPAFRESLEKESHKLFG